MALISAEMYSKLTALTADYRIPYGKDPNQFGDLYLPVDKTGPHPVVFLLHGGCWRAKYDLSPMDQFARALADCGVAVWSLEYRCLGNGGGWPHTFLDVAHGADNLRDMADTYTLDLSRIVAVGHSAGGHLALWSAARSLLTDDSPIYTPNPIPFKSVVALAPVCDLERAVAWDICVDAADLIVGGHPREKFANYYQGSPSALLPLGTRHVTINGAQDDIVPLDYVRQFVKTAQQLGDDASLIAVPDVGHFELVIAAHPVGQQVIDTILAELDR